MSELEPNRSSKFSMEVELLSSIAISLKRIANIMQGKQQPVVMSAEEYAKYQESIK